MKPTTTPTWADDSLAPPNPVADIDTPTAARISVGFDGALPPTAGHLNWLLYWLCQWIGWLDTAPTVYVSQQTAIADTAVGEIAVVDETLAELYGHAGEAIANYATAGKAAGNDLIDMSADGKWIWYAEVGSAIRGQLRSAPGVDAITISKTNAGTISRIVSDGYIVVVAYGQYVEAFLASTGASLWVYDHGAVFLIHDICLQFTYVLAVGERGTGNVTCRLLNRATGASVATYDHNATVRACCWANGRYYIAGAASGYASGATLRALNESLQGATAEAGTADTTGRAWDIVQTDAQTRTGTLASDGRYLYGGLATAAAVQLERRNLITGASESTADLGTHTVQRLAVDQGGLVIATIDTGAADRGYAWGFVRDSLSPAWRYQHTAGRNLDTITTDGSRIWVGAEIAAAENGIQSIARGAGPTIFRRQDHSIVGDSGQSRRPSGLRRFLSAVE